MALLGSAGPGVKCPAAVAEKHPARHLPVPPFDQHDVRMAVAVEIADAGVGGGLRHGLQRHDVERAQAARLERCRGTLVARRPPSIRVKHDDHCDEGGEPTPVRRRSALHGARSYSSAGVFQKVGLPVRRARLVIALDRSRLALPRAKSLRHRRDHTRSDTLHLLFPCSRRSSDRSTARIAD